jgi:[NiFe] hydrogenase diaphorase moiety large subunit
MESFIDKTVRKYDSKTDRLLDILIDIQNKFHSISEEALGMLSKRIDLSVPELKDTMSFYHFFHAKPAGKIIIYADNSAISNMAGGSQILECLSSELNCPVGGTDPEGIFGLYTTPCIGMSDQAPAILVDFQPITNLNLQKVKALIVDLKKKKLPKANVSNQIHRQGPIIFDKHENGASVKCLQNVKPIDVRQDIIQSGLRGRGGAGFSTGQKWQLCYDTKDVSRIVVCNADEGEPGTFKDRFLLMEKAYEVFEGMVTAAYAIRSSTGLFYLRGEYAFMLNHLEKVLEEMRQDNTLGKDIARIAGFDFDIRIQVGAGAYVVGEETALLESLEGKRGEPRVKPPFPVEKGYLGQPTIVNNVETFFHAAKIVKYGADWYRSFGTDKSKGSKLLSVSGDLEKQGIYEIEWGMSLNEFIEMTGAKDVQAIQVGGPSGTLVGKDDFERKLAFEDLATGGSMMIFGNKRKLLDIIKNFTQFFVDESCGCCTPCRAGNIVINEQIDNILAGNASKNDLERIEEWSSIIKTASRCGLGQTSTNPILSCIKNFPSVLNELVSEHEPQLRPFNVEEKLNDFYDSVNN